MKETIFALSTVPGVSAISVFRMSGPNSFKILRKLIKGSFPKSRLATLKKLYWNNELVDKCIVITFEKNQSYTGEKMVEFHCHGSYAIIEKVSSIFTTHRKVLDLRPAYEGEFTKQAFYNGKMDIIQVEGLSDLLRAETEAQRKLSLDQLEGSFSTKVQNWREKMVEIVGFLEAEIDFSDQFLGNVEVLHKIEELDNILESEIKTFSDISVAKEGVEVAIIGPPNVGKSSLINYLSKKEIAITSRLAGTTRDIIESKLQINGISVTFLDTAGLRKTRNIIEKKGISLLKKRLERVFTKIILIEKELDIERLGIPIKDSDILLKAKADKGNKTNYPGISGKTGLGVASLIGLLREKLPRSSIKSGSISTHRQRVKIQELLALIRQIKSSIKCQEDIEIIAENGRVGLVLFEELTGKIDTEEILGTIFKNFCIGK
ncbi:tRNA uridine-5-carboxymethylaminomethyl(34) synthesis GTPase MnmE [Paracoccaceae bacterium]|nr:tRNA uridine-5-carboxymethylaminomethyl(34) synthesis GTPase MnmE [Paracoccaceae bacterium]